MLESNTPKVELIRGSETQATFQIEPLEPGYGVTLGNALRRVLLSSLEGTAVTSIKIDGVYHEFATIPGIREDTSELILNVKRIRLKSYSDQPVQLRLQAKGPGAVTAADLVAPSDVEVVNPEQYLATLDTAEATIDMELVVERGKGYLPSNGREAPSIGVVPIDAVFTPVRRVNYNVERMRVGSRTDLDRLILDIVTDGSISPSDALAESAQILVQYFAIFTELGQTAKRPEIAASGPKMAAGKDYDRPIEDLDLSVRAYNCLKRSGITKVGQVLEMSEEDLLAVRNFGQKSLDELRQRLQAMGYVAASETAGRSDDDLADDEEGAEDGSEEAEADIAMAESDDEDEEDFEEEQVEAGVEDED